MKTTKLNWILVVALMISIATNVNAQELSKKEKKALKKEIKNLLKNPAQYRSMKESADAKDAIINGQLQELRTFEGENRLLKKNIAEARDSIGFYENRVTVLDNSNVSCTDNDGMKYRVQIGLFKEFDIRSFFEQVKVVSFEEADGMFRYTIGNFATEEEAEEFKMAIRKMGITDAFVSFYMNGNRIPK